MAAGADGHAYVVDGVLKLKSDTDTVPSNHLTALAAAITADVSGIDVSYHSELGAGLKELADAIESPAESIVSLYIADTGQEGIGGVARVRGLAVKFPNLTSLNVSDNDLGQSVIVLLSAEPFKSLRTLTCKSCGLEGEAASGLAGALDSMPNLKVLNLWANNIGQEKVAAVCAALSSKSGLVKLDMGWTMKGEEAGTIFAELLSEPTCNLTYLDISGTKIKAAGMEALAAALPDAQRLETFNCRDNGIGPEGLAALAAVLPYTAITSLELEENGFASTMELLVTALQDDGCCITELGLSGNELATNSDSVEDLLSIPKLKRVNLMENGFDDAQLSAILSTAVATNSLESLNLAYNTGGPDVVGVLVGATKCSITDLDVSWILESVEGGSAVLSALASPECSLVSLNVSNCNLGGSVDDVNAIVAALGVNSTLTSLNLATNTFVTEDTEAIVNAALESSTLRVLELDGDDLSSKVLKKLRKAARKRTPPLELTIGCE